jgi:uncharacterized membrane protein YfcA
VLPDLDPTAWALAIAAGLMIGFTKTGVAGMGILVVPMMAAIFPVKQSVGVLLPMLIVGDVIAVSYYRRHTQWRVLLRLLPWVLAGMPLGLLALHYADNAQMKVALGTLLLALIVLAAVQKRWGRWLEAKLPHAWWFAAPMGGLAGFATTLANAAGPITTIYLLVQGLKKREFLGTVAVFYGTVNLLKAGPFTHMGLISGESLVFNACMVPAIGAGAVAGILLLPKIPQRLFEWLILALAAAASVRLMVA